MSFLRRVAVVVVAVACCAVFAETERDSAMTWAVVSAAVVAVVIAAIAPSGEARADEDADVLASRFVGPPTADQLSR